MGKKPPVFKMKRGETSVLSKKIDAQDIYLDACDCDDFERNPGGPISGAAHMPAAYVPAWKKLSYFQRYLANLLMRCHTEFVRYSAGDISDALEYQKYMDDMPASMNEREALSALIATGFFEHDGRIVHIKLKPLPEKPAE